jgi:hypothetical protein
MLSLPRPRTEPAAVSLGESCGQVCGAQCRSDARLDRVRTRALSTVLH